MDPRVREAEAAKREAERKSYEDIRLAIAEFNRLRYNLSTMAEVKASMPDPETGFSAIVNPESRGTLKAGRHFFQDARSRFGVEITLDEHNNNVTIRGAAKNPEDLKLLTEFKATKESVRAYKEYAQSLIKGIQLSGLTDVYFDVNEKSTMTPWKLEILRNEFANAGIGLSAKPESKMAKLMDSWSNTARGFGVATFGEAYGYGIKEHMEQYLQVMKNDFNEDYKKWYGDKFKTVGLSERADVKMTDEQLNNWKDEMTRYLITNPPGQGKILAYDVIRHAQELAKEAETIKAGATYTGDLTAEQKEKLLVEIKRIEELPDVVQSEKDTQKIPIVKNALEQIETKMKELDEKIKAVSALSDDMKAFHRELGKMPEDTEGKNALKAAAHAANKDYEARVAYMNALSAERLSLERQKDVWVDVIRDLNTGPVTLPSSLTTTLPTNLNTLFRDTNVSLSTGSPDSPSMKDQLEGYKRNIDTANSHAATLESVPSAPRSP